MLQRWWRLWRAGSIRRSERWSALAERSIRYLIVAWAASNAGQYALLVINLVVAYQLGGAIGVGVFGLAGTSRRPSGSIRRPARGATWSAETVLRGTNTVRTLAVVGLVGVVVSDAPLWLLMSSSRSRRRRCVPRPLHARLLPAVAQTPRQLIGANVTSGAAEGLGTFIGPALASISWS